MPLLALMLWNTALGLLVARASARELRASPRAAVWTRGFGALAVHQALVAMPIGVYLLARFTDWMVGYLVDGARVPSALMVLAVGVQGALALGGYATAAYWLRAHHPQRAAQAAVALGCLAALAAVVLRRRLGVVGSTLEYRGGFGLTPLGGSRLAPTLGTLGAVAVAAAAHLLWSVHDAGPRER